MSIRYQLSRILIIGGIASGKTNLNLICHQPDNDKLYLKVKYL